MSTKVYTGMIAPGHTLDQLWPLLQSIQKLVTKDYAEWYWDKLVTKDDPVGALTTLFMNKPLQELFEAEMVLFPVEEGVLGIVYGEMSHRRTCKLLAKETVFEDFAYWNNSDQPSTVTDTEWDHRRDTWEKVFEVSWTPGTAGLVYKLCDFPLAVTVLRKRLEEHCANETRTGESASASQNSGQE